MGTVASRLAKLEQQQGGDGGRVVCGTMRVSYDTGIGPDVVRVAHSGEEMTEAEFRRRFPRGLLSLITDYGDPDDNDLLPA